MSCNKGKWILNVIMVIVGILFPVTLAIGTSGRTETVWYISKDRKCVSAEVAFRCDVDGAVGCLGMTGPETGQQLYLTDDCDQPLGYNE